MTMQPTKKTGLARIIAAGGYSFDGLRATWHDEAAFRQEVILTLIMIPVAVYLAPDRLSLALMIACLFLVLITELLNSAIESAIDRHGSEVHPLAKKAKDAGSAAVMVALTLTAMTWMILIV